ncbi:response regulator [Alsobacter sp. SYSU M60028]|uniref:Response regulator n=1 Tax=Alsobacter ponti TaxID=2962936 RepID=A0ABT1L742_9HYPH|nr:response regulator [Alsobacter ponti]MCP8937277.1 response regulator [Alsobacter ponti]
MPISQAIAPHLPYLRRFARALTGNQRIGDIYVQAALESIVADPSRLDPAGEVRLSLYRILLDVWRSVPINAQVDPALPPAEVGALKSLDAVTPRSRIAFLLRSLEGMTNAEVAKVLECSLDEANGLVEEAGREIANQIKTDVLIIEDEPLIALDLQSLVEDLGHRVVDVARTHKEAVAAIARLTPGLILADIQLADGSSGLEAVNEILGMLEVPVIFITAYPERFLTGMRPEPAFLITKPFLTDTVKAVISQALFFQRKAHRAESVTA